MTVFTAAAVLSGNSAYFHFTRGRWQACPRGESAGRGILGEGAENIRLSSPTLDQHLQKTIFATLFLLKSEEISDWAGSYLTSWRTVLLQETKNQIESFPFSSILQRFASQRNLIFASQWEGFDVISLQPETKLSIFRISSLLLLEHMLSRKLLKVVQLVLPTTDSTF